MHLNTKTSTSYLVLYTLSSSFYTSRILSRYIFELAGQLGWLFIILMGILLFLSKNVIYKMIQKPKKPSLFLYIYLLSTIIITLVFLMTLINASWLVETRYTLILVPFLGFCFYLLKQKKDVFLRFTSLCMIPILIQYIIFIFSKNKSLDLYALIAYHEKLSNLPMLLLILIQLYLHFLLPSFYLSECKEEISKKQFHTSLYCILFILCFDAMIVSAQFGSTISSFPFIYYESWCLVNFGQYLGYLDIFAFFYWIISTFIYVCLCLSILKKHIPSQHFNFLFPSLFFVTLFILTHAHLYPIIKPILLVTSSLSLCLCLIGGKTHETI